MISDKWIDNLDLISEVLVDYVRIARIVHHLSTEDRLICKVILQRRDDLAVLDDGFEYYIDSRLRDAFIKNACKNLEGARVGLIKLGFDPEKLTDAK